MDNKLNYNYKEHIHMACRMVLLNIMTHIFLFFKKYFEHLVYIYKEREREHYSMDLVTSIAYMY